jgi:hypothetical protein
MSNGKFIASVENKALRQYTDKEQIRGTAPIESSGEKQPETAANILPPVENKNVQNVAPTIIISPLDEMNRQPVEKPKEAEKGKSAKKKGSEKNKTAGEKDADETPKRKKPLKKAKSPSK